MNVDSNVSWLGSWAEGKKRKPGEIGLLGSDESQPHVPTSNQVFPATMDTIFSNHELK